MDDLSYLINKYLDASIINVIESNGGDYRLANKNYNIAVHCICRIKTYDAWVNVFLDLLNHENVCIRLSAAYALLPYKTKPAIKVLRRCKREPGAVGFTAKMLLNEWMSGNLKFPECENGKVVYQ